MSTARPAAVAGMFYPATQQELQQLVSGCLRGAARAGPAPKAIVVPHAGLVYSGPVAASAYAQLRDRAAQIRRVVLIGPSHRVAFRGLAVPTVDTFVTPLGAVPIDGAARAAALALPGVSESDQAHAREHSLEVQLPFLQTVLGDFQLLPLVAGEATPDAVAAVLERVWGGAETLIVVSTDLSHFHDYATARRLDAGTCRRILALDPVLDGEDACGCVGLNGLLRLAQRRGLEPRQLDLRNSGDTAGDRDRVVGYAAFGFWEKPTQ